MIGVVYKQSRRVGAIRRDSSFKQQYTFAYDPYYLEGSPTPIPVSLTLPLSPEPYRSRTLFSFFGNLIPEGWLLDIASKNWKINRNDRFGLLLATCHDCIGDVAIVSQEEAIVFENRSKNWRLSTQQDKSFETSPHLTQKKFNRCLYCLDPLGATESLYHPHCAKKVFGTSQSPLLSVKLSDIEQLAITTVNERLTMTGVQRKLSPNFAPRAAGHTPKLTIVGLRGRFILKPPSEHFPTMTTNEHLMIRLARSCAIATEECALIPLVSGELAFIARRFDRMAKNQKLSCEDFCQLTERLAEEKYYGSVEQLGKIIDKFSFAPGYDKLRLFEVVVFSFLVGNGDMHNKNYSLLSSMKTKSTETRTLRAPAYDLVSTDLLLPDDNEESALAINGKKNRLTRTDFVKLGRNLGINEAIVSATIARILEQSTQFEMIARKSYLPSDDVDALMGIVRERSARMSYS